MQIIFKNSLAKNIDQLKRILLLTILTTLMFGCDDNSRIAADESYSATGRQLFNSYCLLCHGSSGKGDGQLAQKLGITDTVADLTSKKYASMGTKKLAELIAGYTRASSMMPAWKDTLDARQINQIATYIQTLPIQQAYINGKRVYYRNCAVCHGSDGKGGGATAKELDLEESMPDLTDLKYVQMSESDLVKTIIEYSTKDDKIPLWESQLNAESLSDVAAYIRLNPTGLQILGNKVNGKTIFIRNCIACHGKEGKGDGALAALLNTKMIDYTSKDSFSISDTQLIHTISMGRGEFMPSWLGELSAYDIRDVAAYVRTLYK